MNKKGRRVGRKHRKNRQRLKARARARKPQPKPKTPKGRKPAAAPPKAGEATPAARA